jgi:hypothetical protein
MQPVLVVLVIAGALHMLAALVAGQRNLYGTRGSSTSASPSAAIDSHDPESHTLHYVAMHGYVERLFGCHLFLSLGSPFLSPARPVEEQGLRKRCGLRRLLRRPG